MVLPAYPSPRPFRWTCEEYHRLAELGLFAERRVQLIDGDILQAPPQNRPHAMTIQLVAEALGKAFGEGFSVLSQLPLSLAPASEPVPDIAIVNGTARDYDEHPTSALLVVEVSESNLALDSSRKAALYVRAGIEEYWIVNLVDDRLDVYRKPVVDPKLEFGAGYIEKRSPARNERVSPLAASQALVLVDDLLP